MHRSRQGTTSAALTLTQNSPPKSKIVVKCRTQSDHAGFAMGTRREIMLGRQLSALISLPLWTPFSALQRSRAKNERHVQQVFGCGINLVLFRRLLRECEHAADKDCS